jgi:hypothetical protein
LAGGGLGLVLVAVNPREDGFLAIELYFSTNVLYDYFSIKGKILVV